MIHSQQSDKDRAVAEFTEETALPELLYLPETMQNWPWLRVINPYYEEVTYESNAWLRAFKPLDERSQHAFDICDLGRLAALVYPYASREHLRVGVDLMNVGVIFLVDEYTDVKPKGVVEDIIGVVIDAIHNPRKPRPEGEIVLGEIARQFWERGEKAATPEAAKHFIESCTDHLQSLITQADDRDKGGVRTVDEYFKFRRRNIGLRPALTPGVLHLSIPDCAFYNPIIKKLEYYIIDIVILDNDLASYNKEQATGDDQSNIITVVMYQFNLSLGDAVLWVANYHKEIQAEFLDTLKSVPSWGKDIDEQVSIYLEHLARWPRGNDCWNFERGRYFGSKGLEIQKTRCVPLLRRKPVTRLQKEDVGVALVDSL